NILPLISQHKTISIPSLLMFSVTLTVLGRAMAMVIKTIPNNRNTSIRGFNLTFKDTGKCLIPSNEETLKEASCFLCFLRYQKSNNGISNSNQKKAGLAKVIF